MPGGARIPAAAGAGRRTAGCAAAPAGLAARCCLPGQPGAVPLLAVLCDFHASYETSPSQIGGPCFSHTTSWFTSRETGITRICTQQMRGKHADPAWPCQARVLDLLTAAAAGDGAAAAGGAGASSSAAGAARRKGAEAAARHAAVTCVAAAALHGLDALARRCRGARSHSLPSAVCACSRWPAKRAEGPSDPPLERSSPASCRAGCAASAARCRVCTRMHAADYRIGGMYNAAMRAV